MAGMKNRVARIVVVMALVVGLAFAASAHTVSHDHPCWPKSTHSIISDGGLEGHNRGWSTSIWPGAAYDRITNHYAKPNPSSSWYYTHYTRATCWY